MPGFPSPFTPSQYNINLLAIGRGFMAPAQRPVVIAGYNPDIDNVLEDIWTPGGTYVFPSAPIQMEVVSSNAADTAAGIGIRQVAVSYLDNNHVEQTETVTLAGLVPVPTVAVNILRINYFAAETAGTNQAAVGNIVIRPVGGGATYAQIDTGATRAFQAIYTVPANKIACMLDWTISIGNPSGGRQGQFVYRSTWDFVHQHNHNFLLEIVRMSVQDNAFRMESPTSVTFGPKADIKISAVSDAATASALCTTFSSGWLEPA